MKKRSKRYNKIKEENSSKNLEEINSAIQKVKKNSTAKFDESIDVNFFINAKQGKSELALRTAVNLPNGSGKKVVVAIICEEAKNDEAKDAGADIFGGEDLIKEISDGKINFDKLVSTPGMMSKVGKLGKILGPKGIMPNPKLGTITNDLKSTVQSIKLGQAEIRNDKDGNIGATIGKKSISDEKLLQNFNAVYEVLIKEKPQNLKGNFLKSAYLTSTMGISYKLKVKNI